MVAEVELASESVQPTVPSWVAEEVSSDPRYFNSNLLKNPYKSWPRG